MKLKRNFRGPTIIGVLLCSILLCLVGCAKEAEIDESQQTAQDAVSSESVEEETESSDSNFDNEETIDFLSSLDEFQKAAVEKRNELNLAPTEYVCFSLNGKYITVGGGIRQEDLSALKNTYPDLTISDSYLDYSFKCATFDFKSAPSFQVSDSMPEGVTLDTVFTDSAADDLSGCTYLRFVYGEDDIQITMVPSGSNVAWEGVEWETQSEGEGYAIVADSNAKRTALMVEADSWTYYIESSSQDTGFYDELITMDYKSELPKLEDLPE